MYDMLLNLRHKNKRFEQLSVKPQHCCKIQELGTRKRNHDPMGRWVPLGGHRRMSCPDLIIRGWQRFCFPQCYPGVRLRTTDFA